MGDDVISARIRGRDGWFSTTNLVPSQLQSG